MGLTRRLLTIAAVLATMLLASACSPSLSPTPLLSPWRGVTVGGFGSFATCSAFGGPVKVSAMADGLLYVRVTSGSGVVTEGELHTNLWYPPAFESAPLAPGECFTVTVEVLHLQPFGYGDTSFSVAW